MGMAHGAHGTLRPTQIVDGEHAHINLPLLHAVFTSSSYMKTERRDTFSRLHLLSLSRVGLFNMRSCVDANMWSLVGEWHGHPVIARHCEISRESKIEQLR